MPWLEKSLMNQRTQFMADYQRGLQTLTELAARFGISRKTAYKWIDRDADGGPSALTDRSRRPQSCTHATDPAIVAAVLEARRHHLSTPAQNPTVPPVENPTDRRGDEPQIVAAS